MKSLVVIARVAVLALALFWSASARASAAPIRILIAVGSPTGLAGDQGLVHPRDDARGVLDVFTSIGGVSPQDALLIPDAGVASLRAAFARAEAIARAHSLQDVSFFFYFSGHGDHDALHLAGEALSLKDLGELVARMPAALRFVIIDACRIHTDRAKGVTVEPGFAISVRSNDTASGTVWLFASSDGEVAQESDDVGGALFSHFWTAGLRGAADADGDGRVTLQESFDFAYAQTLLRSARSGAALQRPQEKLELSVTGPVVMTELALNRASLVLRPDRDALYLVYGASSRVLQAELFALPDKSTSLALPAGRYLVQRRLRGAGGAAEVLLSAGGRQVLTSGEFHELAPEALALKGDLVTRPWSVTLMDGAVAGVGLDLGDEGSIEIERRWGSIGAAVRLFGGWGERATAANHVYETSFGGEVGLVRIVPVTARLAFRFGIDARGEWVRQQVTRRDAAIVESVGYPGTAFFSGTAWGGGAHVDARLDLSSAWYVGTQVEGLGLAAKTTTGVEGRALFEARLGVGASF